MDRVWTGRTSTWVDPPIARVAKLAETLRAQGVDIIDLGQAILGISPPRSALDGAQVFLQENAPHGYSPDPGLPALRNAIARMLRDRKHVANATGEGVMVTCGANQAFANALIAVTHPGDEVITFDPGYFDHGYTIRMAGCVEVPVPLQVNNERYVFDLDALVAAVTDRTRVVVLVSPGNPTGAVATRAFLEECCALCRRRGIWILSDETYDALTFDPVFHCSPATIDPDGQVVVLGSFSKILAMAGWRVGYLYGSSRLMEEAFKVQDALVVCAPVVSQRAVLAALECSDAFDCFDAYVKAARAELFRRKNTLLSGIQSWGAVRPRLPDGATFLLARIEAKGSDVTENGVEANDVVFCERLLKETGVVAVPGSAFGAQGQGTIRLSFGNQSCERIAEAAVRMRGFC